MSLSYRGVTYNPKQNAVIASETEQTGVFLGSRYTMKRFNFAERYPSGSAQLSYRGVSYTR
ncbi:MAG: DUF4278 domain-containing protein [Thainema sp.]